MRDTRRMVVPRGYTILGFLGLAAAFGLAVLWFVEKPRPAVWVLVVAGVFGLISLYLIVEGLMRQHEIDDRVLTFGHITGRQSELPWAELRSVNYWRAASWFRLQMNSGQVVHVSIAMTEMAAFARELLARESQLDMDYFTRALLRALVEGYVPSIWSPP